jgi:hypothetical protein
MDEAGDVLAVIVALGFMPGHPQGLVTAGCCSDAQVVGEPLRLATASGVAKGDEKAVSLAPPRAGKGHPFEGKKVLRRSSPPPLRAP